MQRIINADDSDIYDFLAYVAYALPKLTRTKRADKAKVEIHNNVDEKQAGFLDFALDQYVNVGVDELSKEKLTPLLRLKYVDSVSDAIQGLGNPYEIKTVFSWIPKVPIRCQKKLSTLTPTY